MGSSASEVAAGREADHDNAVGVDMVVGRAGANGLDSAPSVEQRNGQDVAVGSEAVAEDEGAETVSGKPIGNFAALQVAREVEIGSSGEDNDSRAVGRAVARIDDGEGGDVFAGITSGFRSFARPQANGLDVQEGIVVAGLGAGGLLLGWRLKSCQQCRRQKNAEVLHLNPPLRWRGL